MKSKMNDKIKVAMNLPRGLIVEMRDSIKNGDYKDMTSLIEYAVDKLLDKGSTADEQIFDLDSLVEYEIDVTGDSPQHSNWSKRGAMKSPPIHIEPFLDLMRARNVIDIHIDNYTQSLLLFQPDKELWGQINRIFPIKAALRGIYAFIASSFTDGYSDITNFHKRSLLAENFGVLGNLFAQSDKEAERPKGLKMSTGFPIGLEYRLEKSTARYLDHYCFTLRKDNSVDGALAKMNFIKIIHDDGVGYKVGITEAGYKFAKLPNPVLDGKTSDLTNPELQTLTSEEVDFLLNHLAEYYPAELNGMKKLLNNIADGANTPMELKHRMEEYLGASQSKNALGTMVNGLVSRCADLSLLYKKKEGLHVTYYVTSDGQSLINN
jgi:Arc/MetJ-type ribon-helix-helix transcriptional regulator